MARCLCGDEFEPCRAQQRYCSERCAALARQRRKRGRDKGSLADTSDKHFIYVLSDPITHVVWYVGMTKDVNRRYRNHLAAKGENEKKNDWILQLRDRNEQPIFSILEEVIGIQTAKRREDYWIHHFREINPALFNTTECNRDNVTLEVCKDNFPSLLNQIIIGDCRELSKQIPDNSIDLIFTDPPYPKEYLPLYGWLAKEAERVLKPGGFLLTYAGNMYLHDVMMSLGCHLSYFWHYIALDSGPGTIVWNKRTVARHKSILAYSKGSGKPRCNTLGVWSGSGKDKKYHMWGQDEQTARYYIDCFSFPDQLIWEPFTGGGTVPVVCRQLRRNFIGFEIDVDTAEIARKRLETIQMPLIEQNTRQLAFGEETA